eukprot:NODE_822_length_3684_cov_0.348117.p1 type:complete len:257 gc:universal NODE_822_length_3684_cov_0.348117:1048-1818(+)
MNSKLSQKEVAQFYFDFSNSENKSHKCKCVTSITMPKNGGYTNYFNHVRLKHKDYISEVTSVRSFSQKKLCTDSSINTYKWIRWILEENVPFTFVDSKWTRMNSNLKAISSKTVTEYMKKMVPMVEQKIADSLPEKIGIMFDSWKSFGSNYVGIFAILLNKQEPVLISLSVLENEESQNAAEFKKKLETILPLFGKQMKDVLFYVLDNCSTNQSMSNLSHKPMIGCYSHRLNLAVRRYMMKHETLFERVLLLYLVK